MLKRTFNEEVFFPIDPLSKLTGQGIQDLKKAALATGRKRARLCMHTEIDDSLHEMFIIHTHDTYVRPHKHLNKVESVCIIEGTADLLLFDNEGAITERTIMGDYSSGAVFYVRISEQCYHSLLIKSEILVFHETTNGPFIRTDTIYAPWSPEDGNVLVTKYLSELHRQCAVET